MARRKHPYETRVGHYITHVRRPDEQLQVASITPNLYICTDAIGGLKFVNKWNAMPVIPVNDYPEKES